jgi:hypothetical protein
MVTVVKPGHVVLYVNNRDERLQSRSYAGDSGDHGFHLNRYQGERPDTAAGK